MVLYGFLSAAGSWRIVLDRVEWQPYGLHFHRALNKNNRIVTRGSFFGYLFAPLILADRASLHQSFKADTPEGQEVSRHEQKNTPPGLEQEEED